MSERQRADHQLSSARTSSRKPALILAFGLVLLHMPSGLPAPLYPVYQATLGITSATVSMLFATYVLGTLIGLMVMPRLVHNRYVLIGACLLSIGADILFLVANGAPSLFAGHLLQGVVLGVFTGAVPVLLAELDLSNVNKTVGRFTTSANAVGLAVGPLWSGLLLEYLPWPGQLVWVVQILATILIMPLMLLPSRPAPVASAQAPIGSVIRTLTGDRIGRVALLMGFCAFASGGLLASIGSVVLGSILGVNNSAVQGALVATCFVLSAIFGAVRFRRDDLDVTARGLAWNAAGSIALVGAVVFTSLPVMALAAVLIGVGQGIGLQGATQLVATHAEDAARGKAISVFFICNYLGTTVASFGVAAAIAVIGLASAFNGFSVIIAVLSLVGLVLVRWRRTVGAEIDTDEGVR